MKHKIAVLVSLLTFVIASTAQAGAATPNASPLASPIEVPMMRVFSSNTHSSVTGKIQIMPLPASSSWWAWIDRIGR